MNFTRIWICILAFCCLSAWQGFAEDAFVLPPAPQRGEDTRSAAQILADCTRIIPTERLMLKGTLTIRQRRGITLSESPYTLLLDWGATPPNAECMLYDDNGTSLVERAVLTRPAGQSAKIRLFSGPEMKPLPAPAFTDRIRTTDMTWLDLTLDFLWWKTVRFDDVSRGTSQNGRESYILLATPPEPIPGCSAMRIWIDCQIGCILQAEQLDMDGKPVRKMWVQRVKKMDERWMIRDMEIETLNSGHRTRLYVESAEKP
jgi:hypothetical protein